MRRSRVEMQLGRFLHIGQQWRRRADNSVWTVKMSHPRDCVVDLRCGDERQCVSFTRLRAEWIWMADQEAA
jgi:hypothetical protein